MEPDELSADEVSLEHHFSTGVWRDNQALICQMSGRQPWMFLIARGHQNVYSKYIGIDMRCVGLPILLHVAKRWCDEHTHKYYKDALVSECLKKDPLTGQIWNDMQQLDDFFANTAQCILGFAVIQKVIKNGDSALKKYPFANKPSGKKFRCHLLWSQGYSGWYTEPIRNIEGSINIVPIGSPAMYHKLLNYDPSKIVIIRNEDESSNPIVI